jgi:1,4-dihydroxy-2-naphthoate octaprenyltransferase
MIRHWILAARPKTLPAAASPVILACALAFHDGVFALRPSALAMGFALLVQIATNFANDYFDFAKGGDGADRIGPTRAVAAGHIRPGTMLAGALGVFALAFAEGLFLFPYGGWPLVVVGALCVLMGLAYSGGPSPLSYNGLADLFVVVFFGLVAVGATYYVQAGALPFRALILGLAPGALSTNVLVVNNYRDIDCDLSAGRRTLIVRFGRRFGAWEYLSMLALAHLVPVILWTAGHDALILLPLMSLPLGLMLERFLVKARTREEFDRVLGGTAVYLLLYSMLLACGLMV